MSIDGQRAGDWDLTGGILVCGDVETGRDKVSVWYHVMYDADNLYLLARWNDTTPLDNPGVTSGDLGFRGDCLQTRVVTSFNQPDEKTTHLTCWQGRDGRDVIDLVWGRQFDQGAVKDAKTKGAEQAFAENADGKGYVQEIAIPWALLTKDGQPPAAGATLRMAVEPNFTIGANGRLSYKDIFQPGMTLDRVFTFMSAPQWGTATLEKQGKLKPRPVRLADGREFAVRMDGGVPVVDWTGLVRSRELTGFKSISLAMPEDGYASVVLRSADGAVVRQLLNCELVTKGKHEVKWNGLTTPNWRVPGEPVPPGDYTWSAIYHTGIGLRLKGWADNAGQTPWDFPANTGNWGGDHGTPTAVVADKDQVYLGWTGAEAGKALVACDLDGRSLWHHTRGGIGGASALAVDGNTVYVLDRITQATLYRLDRTSGQYTSWQGRDTADLPLKDLFDDLQYSRDDRFTLTGGGAEKLYLSRQSWKTRSWSSTLPRGPLSNAIAVSKPDAVTPSPGGQLYVVSEGTKVLAFGADLAAPKTVLNGLTAATAIAVDAAGQMFVGCGDPDNQIKVFAPSGQLVKTIGRAGGRALVGPWTSDGVRFVDGVALDSTGKLWVMENDWTPKRVSVWYVETGKLAHEMFGATDYAAHGGAICPDDPLVVVGHPSEWRIDAQTGQAACTAVITRDGMDCSRFVTIPDGRTYLFVETTDLGGALGRLCISSSRLGDGKYKLRDCRLSTPTIKATRLPIPAATGNPLGEQKDECVWSDANDDVQRPAGRDQRHRRRDPRFNGWYHVGHARRERCTPRKKQFKMQGLTACGIRATTSPKPTKMPAEGLGSADGRTLFAWGEYGRDLAWNRSPWTSPAANSCGNIPTRSWEFTVRTTRRQPKSD